MAEGTPGPELRWFVAAEDPRTAVLKRWIDGVARGRPTTVPWPDPREDLYVVPTLANVGQKQRGGGKLEVKLRLSTEPYFRGGLTGRVERWIKLQPDALAEEALAAVRWCRVPKLRRLVKWSESRRAFLPGAEYLDGAACAVELTELPRHGHVSFGFEAFGPPGETEAAFHAAIERVSTDLPDLAFAQAESLGYPEWLGRVG